MGLKIHPIIVLGQVIFIATSICASEVQRQPEANATRPVSSHLQNEPNQETSGQTTVTSMGALVVPTLTAQQKALFVPIEKATHNGEALASKPSHAEIKGNIDMHKNEYKDGVNVPTDAKAIQYLKPLLIPAKRRLHRPLANFDMPNKKRGEFNGKRTKVSELYEQNDRLNKGKPHLAQQSHRITGRGRSVHKHRHRIPTPHSEWPKREQNLIRNFHVKRIPLKHKLKRKKHRLRTKYKNDVHKPATREYKTDLPSPLFSPLQNETTHGTPRKSTVSSMGTSAVPPFATHHHVRLLPVEEAKHIGIAPISKHLYVDSHGNIDNELKDLKPLVIPAESQLHRQATNFDSMSLNRGNFDVRVTERKAQDVLNGNPSQRELQIVKQSHNIVGRGKVANIQRHGIPYSHNGPLKRRRNRMHKLHVENIPLRHHFKKNKYRLRTKYGNAGHKTVTVKPGADLALLASSLSQNNHNPRTASQTTGTRSGARVAPDLAAKHVRLLPVDKAKRIGAAAASKHLHVDSQGNIDMRIDNDYVPTVKKEIPDLKPLSKPTNRFGKPLPNYEMSSKKRVSFNRQRNEIIPQDELYEMLNKGVPHMMKQPPTKIDTEQTLHLNLPRIPNSHSGPPGSGSRRMHDLKVKNIPLKRQLKRKKHRKKHKNDGHNSATAEFKSNVALPVSSPSQNEPNYLLGTPNSQHESPKRGPSWMHNPNVKKIPLKHQYWLRTNYKNYGIKQVTTESGRTRIVVADPRNTGDTRPKWLIHRTDYHATRTISSPHEKADSAERRSDDMVSSLQILFGASRAVVIGMLAILLMSFLMCCSSLLIRRYLSETFRPENTRQFKYANTRQNAQTSKDAQLQLPHGTVVKKMENMRQTKKKNNEKELRKQATMVTEQQKIKNNEKELRKQATIVTEQNKKKKNEEEFRKQSTTIIDQQKKQTNEEELRKRATMATEQKKKKNNEEELRKQATMITEHVLQSAQTELHKIEENASMVQRLNHLIICEKKKYNEEELRKQATMITEHVLQSAQKELHKEEEKASMVQRLSQRIVCVFRKSKPKVEQPSNSSIGTSLASSSSVKFRKQAEMATEHMLKSTQAELPTEEENLSKLQRFSRSISSIFRKSEPTTIASAKSSIGTSLASSSSSENRSSADSNHSLSQTDGDGRFSPSYLDNSSASQGSYYRYSPSGSDSILSPDYSDHRLSSQGSEYRNTPNSSDRRFSQGFSDHRFSPQGSDFRNSSNSSDRRFSQEYSDYRLSPQGSDYSYTSNDINDFKHPQTDSYHSLVSKNKIPEFSNQNVNSSGYSDDVKIQMPYTETYGDDIEGASGKRVFSYIKNLIPGLATKPGLKNSVESDTEMYNVNLSATNIEAHVVNMMEQNEFEKLRNWYFEQKLDSDPEEDAALLEKRTMIYSMNTDTFGDCKDGETSSWL